jgi:hypothetical protein
MILTLSLIIALALFSLRLILQSATSLATDESERQRLADRLERITLATFVPTGVVMVIVGFIFSALRDGFVSIGFTIMGTSVVLLTQSELTKREGEEALSFARRVRFYGRLFWWVALVAVIIVIVRIALP